jgi:hypothetical protein
MAKAEVSAAETSHGSRLHQAAATILNNTIYSITKHTHQTLEEEQETERRGGDPLLRENIYPARSTNDVTTTRRAPRWLIYIGSTMPGRSASRFGVATTTITFFIPRVLSHLQRFRCHINSVESEKTAQIVFKRLQRQGAVQ